jgi:hypothetical protein
VQADHVEPQRAADASVRSPCSGTSRIVSDASPYAAAGAARKATTAARAIFTAS